MNFAEPREYLCNVEIKIVERPGIDVNKTKLKSRHRFVLCPIIPASRGGQEEKGKVGGIDRDHGANCLSRVQLDGAEGEERRV